MTDQTTDFFDNIGGGAGAPSAVLKNPGDFVHGEIVEFFQRDYVPFGKTEPEEDPAEENGKRKQLVILLQTSERNWANVVKVPKVDPNDPNSAKKPPSDDDGKRAVYAPKRSNIQFAIGKAVQAAQSRFEVGGTLGVKIDKLTDTGKGNPLKEHVAVYKPKADNFFGGGEQTPAPAAQTPPPAAAAPATPAPAPVVETPAPAAPTPAPAAQQDPWASSPATGTSEPPF